jgi:hypothetical protein
MDKKVIKHSSGRRMHGQEGNKTAQWETSIGRRVIKQFSGKGMH